MTLMDAQQGEITTVCDLLGDAELSRRMRSLGLFVGKRIRFIKAGPFSGPLLIEDPVTGARLMIARALARLVEVEREAPDDG